MLHQHLRGVAATSHYRWQTKLSIFASSLPYDGAANNDGPCRLLKKMICNAVVHLMRSRVSHRTLLYKKAPTKAINLGEDRKKIGSMSGLCFLRAFFLRSSGAIVYHYQPSPAPTDVPQICLLYQIIKLSVNTTYYYRRTSKEG